MIYIITGLIGAGWGAFRAKKSGGNGADMAQYAAVFGIVFLLLGFILTLFLDRTVI